MIQDYLKAGYLAILLLTQGPHRAENVLPCEGWNFLAWDCLRGFRRAGKPQTMAEIRDPVEAVNQLGQVQDTVLLAHNLHLFLDISEVIQAIQSGIRFRDLPKMLRKRELRCGPAQRVTTRPPGWKCC
jgi:hypothetical protein